MLEKSLEHVKCCTCTVILPVPSNGGFKFGHGRNKDRRVPWHKATGDLSCRRGQWCLAGLCSDSVLMKPLSFLCRMAAAPDLQTSTQGLFPTLEPHWYQISRHGMSEFWIPIVLHPVLQHPSQEVNQAACAFKEVPFAKASRHWLL